MRLPAVDGDTRAIDIPNDCTPIELEDRWVLNAEVARRIREHDNRSGSRADASDRSPVFAQSRPVRRNRREHRWSVSRLAAL